MEELAAWRIGLCRISVNIFRRRPALYLKSSGSTALLRVAEFASREMAEKYIEAMRGGQQVLFEGGSQPPLIIDDEVPIGEEHWSLKPGATAPAAGSGGPA